MIGDFVSAVATPPSHVDSLYGLCIVAYTLHSFTFHTHL